MASCSSSHGFLTAAHRPKPFRLHQFTPPLPIRRPRSACPQLLASSSDPAADIASSWSPTGHDLSRVDGFGGWFVPRIESPKQNDAPKLVISGVVIGVSVAAVIAGVSYLYFSRKVPRFQFLKPLHHLSEIFQEKEYVQSQGDGKPAEVEAGGDSDLTDSIAAYKLEHSSLSGEWKHRIISVAADSTQLEALDFLKKLNIIESDVTSNDICTRREYARWLVKSNMLLERNTKYKMAPSMLIAGSATTSAFDDVSTGDPDFFYIQAIAETGIVPSKLSDFGDRSNGNAGQKYEFAPESFLSRIDLLWWKTQLEYPLTIGTDEKMLRKNIGFTDLAGVTPDALQGLFMDSLAGDRSITRRVFGNIRRLQPLKPVTKAQAVVAISSGRMSEAIRIELSKIEAENVEKSINKKDIESELIRKGEIQRYWEERMSEERKIGFKVRHELSEISDELEKEKMTYKKEMEYHAKEKAALDCQKRLLLGLKVEVDTMLEKLAIEKVIVASEHHDAEVLLMDLQEKQNTIIEAKSTLEAEIEALRILRSWVEDEARQTQFRAKVLESAVERWKWDDQSGFSSAS